METALLSPPPAATQANWAVCSGTPSLFHSISPRAAPHARPAEAARQADKGLQPVHTPPLQEHRPLQGAPGAPSIPPTHVQTLPPSLRQALAPTGQRGPQAAAGPREEGPEGCPPELRKLLTWGDSQGTQVSGGTAHQRLFPCRALRSEVSAAGTRLDPTEPRSSPWPGPVPGGRSVSRSHALAWRPTASLSPRRLRREAAAAGGHLPRVHCQRDRDPL